MTNHRLSIVALGLSATLSTFAGLAAQTTQAPEDAYWIANRFTNDVQKLSACGELLLSANLGASLRAAYVAPDGKVWVLKFITTSFLIIDANGKNPTTINADKGAYPEDLAFAKNGDALIVVTGRGNTPMGIQRYDKDGKFLSFYDVSGGNPLAITLDQAGDAWVAHRVGPPTMISRVNLTTGKRDDFKAPTTSLTLGGNITADFRGLGQKSDLWVTGDSAPELIQFGNDGSVKKVHVLSSSDTAYGSLAVDANNNLWVTAYSNNKVIHFDTKNATVLKTLPVTGAIGVAMDGRGKVLVTSRLANAATPPSELLRFNPKSYVLEQKTKIGGGPSRPASSNFQNSLVVDPFGDADKDSSINFAEVTSGTSAFDPQSYPAVDLRVEGSNQIGNALAVEIRGSANSKAVLGFAAKRLATPLGSPAWKGSLRLDPNTLLPIFVFVTVPSTLNATIPNDANLVGTVLHMQALYEHSPSAPVEWSNDTCVKVF